MISDVFCKIINGELPAERVFEDDDYLVVKDINPVAPVHWLIMPKKHFEKLDDFGKKDVELLGGALRLADKLAHERGLLKGYRLIINEGEDGGKLVPHLHIHLLGGKRLGQKIVQD
ncbi:MAG: histidine triad nucleotide-binding protein [Candidatus Yanofskybacteria bacterium RIFCSPHIGHO2_01_FULL_45_42]|uniref:Histidine triad nucleotide-binding protein n=3 Tax=Candidatus Yanofskyibacteriota TaxID=1752733 RepID=A0A1F8H655_9BACT|nr:MAG: histidine triad nucleotide-binding protein [Candidatus Yanofskybacteria bacterium RIFCSPHIGHO2_01_FULL_45_42]OGN16370.1 MAG: histidine triad nucleotide-binding protein [Candidatus Yanofskybacteria bacterium RIFCSPHIGHO2_02_FULL_46_19]OGN26835.1 MAG: histidine triad nucleotide-binding protein [Candidatus Yanofskybacteria bacterium RIFCSPLOWO2_01_FULL_45_72]OGN32379.1 MAG: histidine triad nucleotide-binding protein [Candidatus Yanofskybacteria bacterium RIFCSPLOWO2_02_FULL_45_18]